MANGQEYHNEIQLRIHGDEFRLSYSIWYSGQLPDYSIVLNPTVRVAGSKTNDWKIKAGLEFIYNDEGELMNWPEPPVFGDRPAMDEAKVLKCIGKAFSDEEIEIMKQGKTTLRLSAFMNCKGRVLGIGTREIYSHTDKIFTVSPRSIEKLGRLVARYMSFPRAAEALPRMGVKYYEQFYPTIIKFDENGYRITN